MISFNIFIIKLLDLDNISRYLLSISYVKLIDIYIYNVGVEN